jgi:hypothetical protein
MSDEQPNPLRDAIAAALARLDNDEYRLTEITHPYGFNEQQKRFVAAALMLPDVGRDAAETREALEALARGGAGRD